MKNRILSIILAVLLPAAITGVIPVLATGANDTDTIVIAQGDSVDEIQQQIDDALEINDTVIVIGEKTDADVTLTLNIPSGKNVDWKAVYKATAAFSGDLIRLPEGGAFEVSDGIVASEAGNAIYATNSNAEVIISGGTVSSNSKKAGSYAIYAKGSVTVSDGMVKAGAAAGNYAIYASGPIAVSGGIVSAPETIAINITARTSLTISGGTVSSTNGRRVIHANSSGTPVTVSGGLVFTFNDAIVGSGKAIFVSDPASLNVVGDGMIIAWNQGAGVTYNTGDTTHISKMPAEASAVWDKNGEDSGIIYSNGGNEGFIKLPVFVGGDPADFTVLNLTESNPQGGTGWTYAGNTYTVTGDITITGSTTTKRLKVQPGANVNIILDNVNVATYANDLWGIAAGDLDIADATAKITLIGDNYLAGVHVPPGASLVIDGPGSLTSTSIRSAGIGGASGRSAGDWSLPGGPGENSGSVTINGGTLTAISQNGAGIGGGSGGNGFSGLGGRGGDGGSGGNGGNLTINGGTVTAISKNGAAIGGGAGGDGGPGSITGTKGNNGIAGTTYLALSSYQWWTNTTNTDPGSPGMLYPPTAYAYSSEDKFVRIDTIEQAQGVTVTGNVCSYNPKNETIVQLVQGDQVTYETVIPSETTTGSGQVEQSFTFANVMPGEYTLVISKKAHTRLTMYNVIIGSEDFDFTPNKRGANGAIALPCGDINSDGMINDGDLTILWMLENYNRKTSAAAEQLCDLNGDGMINDMDLTILWMANNYNRGELSYNIPN